MQHINFFTPVYYNDSPKSTSQCFLEAVDSYFYLGGKKAEVISISPTDYREKITLTEDTLSTCTVALKILSYMTLVIPLILLITKAILRSSRQFYMDACHGSKITSTPEQQDNAVVQIQRVFRGHLARVKAKQIRKYKLPYQLLQKAEEYIDNKDKLRKLPKALFGCSRVSSLQEVPLIIKENSFFGDFQSRFEKMIAAHEICERNGYQHLIIPRAGICRKQYLVESRLPVPISRDMKEHMGFYVENHEQFTEAVKEFTGFLCQSSLRDIIGAIKNIYVPLSETPIGRYDNLLLYVEEGQGKIGLVDLEGFRPTADRLRTYEGYEGDDAWCLSRCKTAVCLFPYHLDAILEAAKKFSPNIEKHKCLLEGVRDGALKRLAIVYDNHARFILQQGISLDDPKKLVEISEARVEAITHGVIKQLRNEHNNGEFKDFLGDQSEEILGVLQERLPKIIQLIPDFLALYLSNKQRRMKKPISSNIQLLSFRTLMFDMSNYTSRFTKQFNLLAKVNDIITIKNEEDSDDEETIFESCDDETLCLQLTMDSIFSELAKGKEIAYFHPKLGIAGHAKKVLFV